MNRSLYGERDYAFGQLILTLRTQIGLTQTGLAERLGISRKAVAGWEGGNSYPTAEHLQELIALAVRTSAFPARHEAEEIRALWHAAHQKVLLDEAWLASLLGHTRPSLTLLHPEPQEARRPGGLPSTQPTHVPLLDWGEALDVSTFYGREPELATLVRWVVEERCRVVSVLGLGGIGKSALAIKAMHQVARHFDVVIWRSLRDSPTCATLVQSCLQILDPQAQPEVPDVLEERLSRLMEQLRARRVLLVLDNVEALLEAGTSTGFLHADAQEYARLFRHLGETRHQSCLLLTSREKLADLVALEGDRSPVRALRLAGLDDLAGAQVLTEKEVGGSPQDRGRLVEVYQGNPLALQIVARTIVELFGGEIIPFLRQGEVVFGGVRELLDEHYARLSALEQTVLCWLAILREPVSLEELLHVLVAPLSPPQLLEAVDGLRRRSLIERGQRAGSFTLQSVVLEYVANRLVTTASQEIQHGRLRLLREHGLSQAQAKEYVRQTQERLLLTPLLDFLKSVYRERAEVEERLRELLSTLRPWDEVVQGYGPANLVGLLLKLRGDLRGLDLSQLALRGAYLQGVEMQDAKLSGALIHESVFTEPLDAILAVAVSKMGAYWAAATRRGEIRVWDSGGLMLRHVWRAHTEMVWTLAFSPNERMLASASSNGNIKLWDADSGILLWETWLVKGVAWLAFSPDGRVLASGGVNGIVHLWDPQHGTPLEELAHASAIFSLAWSPDGRQLASGCADGSIWLWQPELPAPETRVQVLKAHTRWVTGLAFSPDSTQLASASYDGTVKQWDLTTRACLQTFFGHTDRVLKVVWSPDGRTLASCGYDATIQFWDLQTGRVCRVLHGHTGAVTSLAFTPDSLTLLSSSYDGALRVWEVQSGKLLHTIGGYTASLLDLDWSPDGTQLASGGADALLTLWDVASGALQSVLRGHRDIIQGVAWSPDGRMLASGGRDGIGLWDPTTGVRLHELRDPEVADTLFQGVAWSPNGCFLACGSYLRGAQVWEMSTLSRRWVGQTQAIRIRRVAWSADGRLLAGGGDDGCLYVWNSGDGILRRQLVGHDGGVMSVAWSPDGRWLASGSDGKESKQLLVWEVHSGGLVHALTGHSQVVSAVVWSPRGELLISGDSDGTLRWWKVESGQCLKVQEGHQGMVQALKVSPDGSRLASCGDDGAIQLWDLHSGEHVRTLRRDRPYERLNITGIRGLSEAQKASLRALGAFEDKKLSTS